MLVLLAVLLAGAIAGFVVGYRHGRRLPEPEHPYVALEPPMAWAEDATYRRIVSHDG